MSSRLRCNKEYRGILSISFPVHMYMVFVLCKYCNYHNIDYANKKKFLEHSTYNCIILFKHSANKICIGCHQLR